MEGHGKNSWPPKSKYILAVMLASETLLAARPFTDIWTFLSM
jgi:hypothetical protein